MRLSKKHEIIIKKHIPAKSFPLIKTWLEKYPVHLAIVGERSSKAGDYRMPSPGRPPRITVNVSGNPYRFLFILTHEYAHHIAYNNYGIHISPHGREWKNTFHKLLFQLDKAGVFPIEISSALPENPSSLRATMSGNRSLCRAIEQQCKEKKNKIYIEDIPVDTVFFLPDGKRFRKVKKRRVRFMCQSLQNKRYYLFPPGVQVFLPETGT